MTPGITKERGRDEGKKSLVKEESWVKTSQSPTMDPVERVTAGMG